MKKLLLLTLAIVKLTSLVYSQNSPTKKNDWEKSYLKGKVKSFTQSTYHAEDRFGEVQKKEGGPGSAGSFSGKRTNKFDDKGNKIEENVYNWNGSLYYSYKNEYLRYFHENKIKDTIYTPDGDIEYTNTNKYDNKDNIIEENRYFWDGSFMSNYTYKYEFDKIGNWTKKISFENQIPEYIEERIYEYYE